MEIDGTPGVAFEAGVEEACRVLQRGALGEGHLHDILVRLTGADRSGVRPHRNPSPLPLLDHFGVGLLDENSDPSERLAPPITQLLDPRIYQLRGRASSFSFLRAALPVLHGCCRFLHGCLSLACHLEYLAHRLDCTANRVGDRPPTSAACRPTEAASVSQSRAMFTARRHGPREPRGPGLLDQAQALR